MVRRGRSVRVAGARGQVPALLVKKSRCPPGVAMMRARGIGPSVGEAMRRSAGNPGELASAEEMPLLADLHLQNTA